MTERKFRHPFDSPEGYDHRTAHPGAGEGLWFVFRGDALLVRPGAPAHEPPEDPRAVPRYADARLPAGERPPPAGEAIYLGLLGELHCFAADAPAGAAAPPAHDWLGLRSLFGVLDDRHFALAGRALQLLTWDRTHRYCGRCGTPTVPRSDERVRVCPSCGLAAYPRLAPAVMALVLRGRELLLARSPHFPPGMYSALAGFVEPGETLEQCLEREVEEEVGVRVANLRYVASQPWPFPHSLMIAFTCEWVSGELRPQAGEIEDARWFGVYELPKLPSRISIARRLIDGVVAELRGRG